MSNQDQNAEYQHEEPSIERCPHDRENPYAQISRNLIRDNSISPECRMLLIYLLSMKDGWIINPCQIATNFKGHFGKNKVYDLINEAIEAGYMKRTYEKNKEIKNLKDKAKYYLSESPKFKKCFRNPDFREHETRDYENSDYKKEHHSSSEEESLNKESSSSRIKEDDDDFDFSKLDDDLLKIYSPQQLKEAKLRTEKYCKNAKAQEAYYLKVLENLPKSNAHQEVNSSALKTGLPTPDKKIHPNVEENIKITERFIIEKKWGSLFIRDSYVEDKYFSGKDVSLNMEPKLFEMSLINLYESLNR